MKVFLKVMDNIKKKLDYKNKNYMELNEGDHIMIKKNCKISGKRLITQRINLRNENIIGTILNNFSGGIYSIRVDESFNNYEEGLELIVNDKQIVYLSDKDWKSIKNNLKTKDISLKKGNYNDNIGNKKIKKNRKYRK